MTFVYNFTDIPDVGTDLKGLLGGKGANLNIMTNLLGLPVPQGFTIPTTSYHNHVGRTDLLPELTAKVKDAVVDLEVESGRNFGGEKPLLVSVRSGAAVSCPGMLETILNLGMNPDTVKALAAETNEDFAYDSYRRFIQMYAVTVLDSNPHWFSHRSQTVAKFFDARPIPAVGSQLLIETFLDHVEIPTNVHTQLEQAILAVFRSWNSEKAVVYRDIENIPHDIGTAVTVQRMVFGNLNNNSGTGVAFTRNPNTGEKVAYGDFLVNAQGEDVVDGSTVTQPLSDMHNVFPTQAAQLDEIMEVLELHYNDMCDIEFTIENNELFMLQTRIGKRSSLAEIRIVADLISEGLINSGEGVARLDKAHTNLAAKVDVEFEGTVIATGLGASGGLVVGKAYFTKESAIEAADKGEDVILVRKETSPEDTAAMAKSKGILTLTGGLVSHAAVVARSWDKTAVVGLGDQHTLGSGWIRFLHAADRVNEGDTIGINGTTGEVLLPSNQATVPPKKGKPGPTPSSIKNAMLGHKPGLPTPSRIKNTKHLEKEKTYILPGSKGNPLQAHYAIETDWIGGFKTVDKPSEWKKYSGYLFNHDVRMAVVEIVSPHIVILKAIPGYMISTAVVWRHNINHHNLLPLEEES